MAVPGLSEIITSTQRNRPGRLIDNMSKNNALMAELKRLKRIKLESGGRSIVRELEFAENASFGYFDGYDVLNTAPSEVISAAEFNWKNASVAASISGSEKRQNNGSRHQVINLMKARVKNAEKTLMQKIAVDLYSDGTGSGGKQIGGLQLLVAVTPTSGTVGGIDRASWIFWRNISFDATTDGGAAATSANIQSYMHQTWLQITRRSMGDQPKVIVADNNYYRLFWESLTPLQRFGDANEAELGFEVLKYQGAKVCYDGGIGGGASANRMYFLQTDYIDLTIHEDANFAPLGPDPRVPVNQDAEIVVLGFMGNLTISNCFVQGLLKD